MFSGVPTNFVRALSFFTTSIGTTPRSNGPDVAILISSGVAANVMSSLWPVAFSKRGPSSFRLAVIEPPARTFSSDARTAAIGAMAAIATPSSVAVIEGLSIGTPFVAKARGKGHYCAAVSSKKPGVRCNDRIGSRKGDSHARDDDRCIGYNFAQHCRGCTGSGPAVAEPVDAATSRIAWHDRPASAGWPSSADGALASAFCAQGRGLHQTAGGRPLGAYSKHLQELLRTSGAAFPPVRWWSRAHARSDHSFGGAGEPLRLWRDS